VPAVGLYCMEMESCSSDECQISKTIYLYPWIRWNPELSDRVMYISPDTELCHSSIVESLSRSISCLSVCDIGVMSNIPTVSKHLTDILSVEGSNSANDNILYKHATARHLEAADELLSVLSDAVYLRVMCQDAKCNICLLQQHSADATSTTQAGNCDFSVAHSSKTSTDKVISRTSINVQVDFAAEFQSDSKLQPQSCESGLCDFQAQRCKQIVDDAVSSRCDHLCNVSTQKSQSTTSLSNGQVNITKLLVTFITTVTYEFCLTR